MARSASAATSRQPARWATCWVGAVRGPPSRHRRRARHDASRAGRLAAAGATARTAAVLRRGGASLRHVDVVARVLGSKAAARLTPEQWAGAEEQIAAKTADYTPTELYAWGTGWSRHWIRTVRAGRPAAGAGQRAVPDPHRHRRRQAQGPVRRRGDVRRDRRRDRREGEAADRRRRPLRGRAAGRGTGRRVRVRAGPRALVDGARVRRAPPARERAGPAGGPGEPGARRGARLRRHARRPSRCGCCAATRRWCRSSWTAPGQPLDVGRATRTIPDGLRRAVAARDRGCAHPGCDRPPSWCECHHIVPWECGGETKLSNLAMLCRVHHRQIHSTEWICRIRDGLPEFIPPAWIDPERRPRRKALPHLARADFAPAG